MKNWAWWVIGVVAVCLTIGAALFTAQTNPIVRTKTVNLTVVAQPGDFQIAASDALQVTAGGNTAFTIDVVPLLGFNRPVKFTVSGGPAGMVVSWFNNDDTWNPGQGNIQCDISVPLDNGLVGTYPLTLTGTSQ